MYLVKWNYIYHYLSPRPLILNILPKNLKFGNKMEKSCEYPQCWTHENQIGTTVYGIIQLTNIYSYKLATIGQTSADYKLLPFIVSIRVSETEWMQPQAVVI